MTWCNEGRLCSFLHVRCSVCIGIEQEEQVEQDVV
jgi:hypothetical protein